MRPAVAGSTAVVFFVPGEPVGKARTRPVYGAKGYMLTEKTRGFQARVGAAALEAGLRKLPPGPLTVSWIACFAQPERPPRSGAVSAIDRDNIDKAVLDGLKFAFNDNRVCAGLTYKCHVHPARAGVYIAVTHGPSRSPVMDVMRSFRILAEAADVAWMWE